MESVRIGQVVRFGPVELTSFPDGFLLDGNGQFQGSTRTGGTAQAGPVGVVSFK